ncbi:hypothetical protein [Rhodanobacter sp. DHB23]|uniref:hypothetical protein n=1 Tax=Rhodanobacter sp. DHB23 TaxID=2775923 RepID=UPI00177E5F6F|nr:hypothetical protein [Rhodanobacter sp. DHB23]MBD8871361.1 hypothetical protein [Rhodanobacter sp. DHB23]
MRVDNKKFDNNTITYAVTSKFKQQGGPSRTVIVTLFSRATQNTFYDKHVLPVGESSRQTWSDRKGSMDNAGWNYQSVVNSINKGIFTGANRSTFIRLKNIDVKVMVYRLAKALLENYLQGAWPGGAGTYALHLPVEAVFDEANSVVSYDGAGNKNYARSILMGATLVSINGNDLNFDLNHCGGNGSV